MEININFLTQNEKKQLLEEAMSGIAAATIAKWSLAMTHLSKMLTEIISVLFLPI